MHELSIALSIVEECSLTARSRGSSQVTAVYLKLGPLSGVVQEALLFSYELACAGTPLEGSCLMIEEVPVVVYCPACKAEKTLSSIQQFCCPNCGTLTSDLVKGRELEIVAIEIEETVPKAEQVENDCRFEEVAG